MSEENKVSITSNLMWRLLERFGAQSVAFIVSIVIARQLDTNDYGMIALVTVFISIMQVFVDSGLGNALIQKKDADDMDFASVFYFNFVFCILLYAIMFFCAPAISRFYDMPELVPVIRALSITIIVSGIKNVQQAYVSRKMMFRKFFWATLGGTIGAAIVGIILAYSGFGVWALVTQHVLNAIIDTIILWLTVKWRPKKVFSFYRLKELLSFGWKLLVAKLIDTIYEDVRTLIIGKKYSSVDLAFYNRGKQFPDFAVSIINPSIESVLFPAMSVEQDNLERIKNMTSRAIKITSYTIMPIMVGLAICAEPIVSIILTDKWIECVPYMRVFCIAYAIVPITIANLNAVKAVGRSDIYLKLEVARKIVNTISLLGLMWYGVKAIAYSYLLNCIVNLVINSYPNKKIMNYGYFRQIRDIIPAVLISASMGLITYSVSFLELSNLITLIIQVPLGIMSYIFLSIVFKVDSFYYLVDIIKNNIRKKA